MPPFITTIIEKALANRFYSNFALALAFAGALTALAGHLNGFLVVNREWPWVDNPTHGPIWWILFSLLTIVFYATSYMVTRDAKKDVLSPLREMIVGRWCFEFDTYRFGDVSNHPTRDVVFGRFTNACEFSIDPKTAKLRLKLEVRDTDVFEQADLVTTNIHLEDRGDRCDVFFYDVFEYSVRREYHQDFGAPTVTMPILVCFSFDLGGAKPNKMKGYWYDIENSVLSILSKLASDAELMEMRNKLCDGRKTLREGVEFRRIATVAAAPGEK